MNLEEYKHWYIRDEGHWYVSKVKQYNPQSIQLFAESLRIISKVFSAKRKSDIWSSYAEFIPQDVDLKNGIFINKFSKLYVSLLILQNNLIDLSHLEATNEKKFRIFIEIQKKFIEGEDYEFFIQTYGESFLVQNLTVYYRNFKSWLGKFGFYAEYKNKSVFITDVGRHFLENCDDIEICSALFLNQIKKYQLWNPTIDDKYSDIRVRPYYLLLEVLLKINGYFTKEEYVLFITKLKSHNEIEVSEIVDLLLAFRSLDPEEKKAYVKDIKKLDKAIFRKKKRTNYDRLIDSASKEIDCYGYGGLIDNGKGRYAGTFVLTNNSKAQKELYSFRSQTTFIEFNDELSWISHLGSLEGISIDSIIDLYLESGMSMDSIKANLGDQQEIIDVLEDKIYEKEIEDYYVNNIKEIHSDLEVIKQPTYGRQFNTHIGPIDILCIDNKTKEYVVCELKRGQASDETIGQLLRYMGWVYEHLANYESSVKGILIGSDFDIKIDYSLQGIQNEEIYHLISKFKHPFTAENRPKL